MTKDQNIAALSKEVDQRRDERDEARDNLRAVRNELERERKRNAELSDARRQHARAVEEQERLRLELRELYYSDDATRRTLNDERGKVAQLAGELAKAREAVDRVSLEARELEIERDQVRKELAEARAELECRKADADFLEGAEALAQERAHALGLEVDEGREAIAWYRSELERYRRAAVRWRLRRERDRAVIRHLRDLRDALQREVDERGAAIDQAGEDLRELLASKNRVLFGARRACRKLHHQRDTMRALVQTRGYVIDALTKERNDARAELQELSQERDAVRRLLGAAPHEHTEEAAARVVAELGRLRGLLAARGEGYLLELAPPPTAPSPAEDLALPPGWTWADCECGCHGWLVQSGAGVAGRVHRTERIWEWWTPSGGWVDPSTGGRWTARVALARALRAAAAVREDATSTHATLAPTESSPGARAAGAWPGPRPEPPPDLSLPPGCRWETGLIVARVRGAAGEWLGAVAAASGDRWSWQARPANDRLQGGDEPSETAARAALAARLRASFATEAPDHCTPDHASEGAFRAPCPRPCSGAGEQGCAGEQSSPEPAGPTLGDLVRAADAAGCELEVSFTPRDPCTVDQPARPIRAAREGRRGRGFPRSGGPAGIGGLSGPAVKGKVGIMGEVAKGGPSPADRGLAENQGNPRRFVKPECAEGASEGGPEPRAGGSAGWFGTVGEGERVDPGELLRVAVPVFGPVDLLWWLCVRLAWLCGVRAAEDDDLPPAGRESRQDRGALWIGIGWGRAHSCAAWIGFVPADEPPHDGWPVGWEWDRAPSPPLWSTNPDADERAPQEPGSVGILVRGEDGLACLACWLTPWGDRWQAPGFDRARLLALLRVELADAEETAANREEDDPDAGDDLPELPAGFVWRDLLGGALLVVRTAEPRETIGMVHSPGDPSGHFWSAYPFDAGGKAANRYAAADDLAALVWEHADGLRRPVPVPSPAPEPSPLTCRTGNDPADTRAADLPPLPPGYRWRDLNDHEAVVERTDSEGFTWKEARIVRLGAPQGFGWEWEIVGTSRLGPSAGGICGTRTTAARTIADELRSRIDAAGEG